VVLTPAPRAFCVTKQAGAVSDVCRPILLPTAGWRALLRKKNKRLVNS
jgi:hypothetical protein